MTMPATHTYTIDARTVPFPRQGWESSGRQIPTFKLTSFDAASAAHMAARILMETHPDIEQAHTCAVSVLGTDGPVEDAMHMLRRTGPGTVPETVTKHTN